jgi:hypothetical protein
MLFLASLTYAIIEGGDAGWSSTRVQVSAILAVAAVTGFVARERRAPEPLIDLRFFRSVPFTGATLTAIAAFIALGGFLLVTNLYLQGDRGLSPVHSGLYTLPMAALAFLAAPLSGRIVGRHRARVPLLVGGLGLVGISLGVAIIGSIVVSSRDAGGGSIAAASHPGWWICVACGLVVVAMAFISTTERALNSARLVEAATA